MENQVQSSAGSELSSSYPAGLHGLILRFVRHPVAANLLMVAIILGGLLILTRINTQFFPTTENPALTVRITWPGANPDDVAKTILDRVEANLRFLDNMDGISSSAYSGGARIFLLYTEGTNMDVAVSELEQALGSVSGLPSDAEIQPVNRFRFFDRVSRLIISGPFTDQALKAYAQEIRDELLASGLTKVDVQGAVEDEYIIAVDEQKLTRYGLTLDQVASRISQLNLDQPIGIIEGTTQRQLRYVGRTLSLEGLANIPLVTSQRGDRIIVRDVATITRATPEDTSFYRLNGEKAVVLNVQRGNNIGTLESYDILTSYLEEKKQVLPPSLKITNIQTSAKYVVDRVNLLLVNGLQGLAIICVIFLLYLNGWIALWVAVGIPVSLCVTFMLMYYTGQTLNSISLVALIMVLGIVSHDSILIGEHTATLWQKGMPAEQAAERAVLRMTNNVLAAAITTFFSYMTLFFIKGTIGQIITAIPLVVIVALFASTMECLFMLPAHLKHTLGWLERRRKRKNRDDVSSGGRQNLISRSFDHFRYKWVLPVIALAARWRYVSLVALFGITIVTASMVFSGKVKFAFFPQGEGENVAVQVAFVPGITEIERDQAVQLIDDALRKAEEELLPENDNKPFLIAALYNFSRGGTSSNVVRITLELTPTEDRTVSISQLSDTWLNNLPDIPGLDQFSVAGQRSGPRGADVDIQLSGRNLEVLKNAATDLIRQLENFQGLEGVTDDMPWGMNDYILKLTPRGEAMGFTAASLSSQVKNQLSGVTAQRLPAGENELTITVQSAKRKGDLHSLYGLKVRSPKGENVPLSEVASIFEQKAFSSISRRDGMMSVSVLANVDPTIGNADEVLSALETSVLPSLRETYAVDYAFRGVSEMQAQAFGDIQIGVIVSVLLIFVTLALTFGNYRQPIVLILLLPFPLVAVIWGHYLLGFDLTIMSYITYLGLTGLVVNDGIVLIDRMNERIKNGETLIEASTTAAADRLRALLLSLFTDLGATLPLLFQTSAQAQFLIPVAITLVFGIAGTTLIAIFILPSVLLIWEDIRSLFRGIWRGEWRFDHALQRPEQLRPVQIY